MIHRTGQVLASVIVIAIVAAVVLTHNSPAVPSARSRPTVQDLLKRELRAAGPHLAPRVIDTVPQVIVEGSACEVATSGSPCVTAVPRTLFTVAR